MVIINWAGEKIIMGGEKMSELKQTEIMGWAGNDVILLEEQDEGSLMLEITPLTLGQKSARLFLNETGIKRLREFLNKTP